MALKIKAPMSREEARKLRAGDTCLISGTIYTARDAAHKRLCALVAEVEWSRITAPLCVRGSSLENAYSAVG